MARKESIPQDPARSYFLQLQDYLVTNAEIAYNKSTFRARNDWMARVVGMESSLLAVGFKNPELFPPVSKVFTEAVTVAGLLFEDAFTLEGEPIKAIQGKVIEEKDKEKYAKAFSIYENAIGAAGPVAIAFLPEVLNAAELPTGTGSDLIKVRKGDTKKVTIQELITSLTFNDIILFVARSLHMDFRFARDIASLSPKEIIKILEETVHKNNHFYEISQNPHIMANFSGKYEYNLTKVAEDILDIATRLANATWKEGCVHKARWEGSMERINPEKRNGVFNVYDQMRLNRYAKVTKEKKSTKAALLDTAFESYKEIIELARTDIPTDFMTTINQLKSKIALPEL